MTEDIKQHKLSENTKPSIDYSVRHEPSLHSFPYNWTIKDAVFTKDKGTVFSCFACGGGSSFGYKLAGFDVIGHNDIDKKMIEVYKANHNPKYSFLESITTFAKRNRFTSRNFIRGRSVALAYNGQGYSQCHVNYNNFQIINNE